MQKSVMQNREELATCITGCCSPTVRDFGLELVPARRELVVVFRSNVFQTMFQHDEPGSSMDGEQEATNKKIVRQRDVIF
jgi:hypothetical protein